ncbi:MAG: IgGFc-binding protein [Bradymonadales bacterium]|nr:IgGFc-binding protein [Bradymonadales bacterium]
MLLLSLAFPLTWSCSSPSSDVGHDLPDQTGDDTSPLDQPGLDPVDGSGLDDGLLCEPGSRVCVSATTYLECSQDGMSRQQIQCGPGLGCLDGECQEIICEPHEVRGCYGESALDICNFSGTAWVIEQCPPYWTCEEGRCVEPPCLPGSHRCDGIDVILTCDPSTGLYTPQEQCAAGTGCYEDTCQPLCEISRKIRNYMGCEYWTVDLDNYEEAESMEHTVVLSNPSADFSAEVSVVDAEGLSLSIEDTTVPAGGQLVIRFPNDRGLIEPGVTNNSWFITSTVPLLAHQFNPLDNDLDPFSNDGTLLLPDHALSNEYYAASWVHREHPSAPLNGFVSIVAVADDPIEVHVVSSTNALVGDGQSPMAPGEHRSWSLDWGQTLTLQTVGAGDDLTGSHIWSVGGPIAVFGGHECANVILGVDRCDHIETQLLPVDLLRNEYLAVKFQPRVPPGTRSEPDYWRVVAVSGATTLTTVPEIAEVHGVILGSGEWIEFPYRDDFRIIADHPILVAHYMVGANWTGIPRECYDNTGPPTGIGDPAMTQLIPTDQFRKDYLVLTPFAYLQDYLNLALPAEAVPSARLDGQPISPDLFVPMADGAYSVARVLVEDGPHWVTADQPFGLDAYGYSCHVSYAYPGGLELKISQ